MKLDDIQTMWEKDCTFDRTELGRASLEIPALHSKYYKIFIAERLALRKLQQEYKDLLRLKMEYYSGSMDKDQLREYGWEPQPLKILRQDMQIYIDSDKHIAELSLKIGYQQEKVDFVESIIKSLNNRGFNIKSAIEWEKFKVGA